MATESRTGCRARCRPRWIRGRVYAADLGMKVALIDEEKNPGGVCLYRGCIPSKALLHVAEVIGEARHARAWGVTFAEPNVDVDRLRAYKRGSWTS